MPESPPDPMPTRIVADSDVLAEHIVSASRDPFHMKQALIPLLNSVALFKSALLGEFPPGPVLVTLLVLAVATAAALAFAARIVAREDVYLEPRMRLRELLTGRGGSS